MGKMKKLTECRSCGSPMGWGALARCPKCGMLGGGKGKRPISSHSPGTILVALMFLALLLSFVILWVKSEKSTVAPEGKEVQQFQASPPASGEISYIKARGKTFRIGDTADEVFKTLKPSDSTGKKIKTDPTKPDSLLVTHYYEVDGKFFSLTFARTTDPGPYRLIRISSAVPPRDNVTSSPASLPRSSGETSSQKSDSPYIKGYARGQAIALVSLANYDRIISLFGSLDNYKSGIFDKASNESGYTGREAEQYRKGVIAGFEAEAKHIVKHGKPSIK